MEPEKIAAAVVEIERVDVAVVKMEQVGAAVVEVWDGGPVGLFAPWNKEMAVQKPGSSHHLEHQWCFPFRAVVFFCRWGEVRHWHTCS